MGIKNDIRNYNLQFDIIRSLAIIFVICIHCMGTMEDYLSSETINCKIKLMGGVLNSIIHSGVPLFVMLSGALLLGKVEPIGLFLKKRMKRIIVPFFIWSLVVFIFKVIEAPVMNEKNLFISFISQFITNGIHGIYWYIYLILGLYLLTPALRVFFVNANKVQIYYLGCIMLLIYLFSVMLPEILIFSRFSSRNLVYLTYFVGGYIIYKYLVREILFQRCVYIGLLLSFGGGVSQIWNFSFDFPWMFFTSIFLFSFLIIIKINLKPSVEKMIRFISSTSYGIYLSHFMFISLFLKLGFSDYISLIMEPIAMTMVVLLAEIIMMWGIRYIKIDKYLL